MRKIIMIMAIAAFLAIGAFAGCSNSGEEAPAPAAANATQAN